MTINELNNLVCIVGEYFHKINNISKSFMKSNDYQSFMGLNADCLVISKCFIVLGNLYVCTHSDSLELSVEVQELISKTFEIASKCCLVVSNDNDDVIDNIDVTEKYVYMIQAFECDFELARTNVYDLNSIDLTNDRVSKDIDLLAELSYLLRYKKSKIILVFNEEE